MARETGMSQSLMSGALLHFQSGVPIDDLDMRREHKDRLARVEHVYWQWMKNPFLDTLQLFKQLNRGHYSDAANEHHASQKDNKLFEFVVEHIHSGSRRQDEAKVRFAAERMIRIGLETDNVTALDKGSKRLYEVAGLDKPEQEQQDMSKVMFLPPVVTTNVTDVDPTKEEITDQQALAIIKKYGAYQDGKRLAIEDRVNTMMAEREADEMEREQKQNSHEQTWNQSEPEQ